MATDYGDQTKYKASPYDIDQSKTITAAGMRTALGTKEDVANKQQGAAGTLTASSSDIYYPSSQLVGENLDVIRQNTGGFLAARYSYDGSGMTPFWIKILDLEMKQEPYTGYNNIFSAEYFNTGSHGVPSKYGRGVIDIIGRNSQFLCIRAHKFLGTGQKFGYKVNGRVITLYLHDVLGWCMCYLRNVYIEEINYVNYADITPQFLNDPSITDVVFE